MLATAESPPTSSVKQAGHGQLHLDVELEIAAHLGKRVMPMDRDLLLLGLLEL